MIEQLGLISYGDHDGGWSGADGWEIGGDGAEAEQQPLRQLAESAASCGPVDIHKHLADLNRWMDGAVAKAVYAAYLLYLQLVQPADERRVTAWLWGKDELGVLEAELITDAHQYLTR